MITIALEYCSAMAKAYLESCDPNFIIGDNDTFPLWYAQKLKA
jgi:hypothetical protein